MPTPRISKITTPRKSSARKPSETPRKEATPTARKSSVTPRKATTPTRPPRATPRRSTTATSKVVRSPVRGASPRKATPTAHVEPVPNDNGEEGIVVAIRMRPLNSKESTSESATSDVANRVWRVLPQYNSVTQTTSTGQPLPERVTGRTFFSFDRTFGEDATTQNVYDGVAKNIVQSAVTGLNGTIFAYGQTSSGKTYTMQGSGSIDEGRRVGGGGVVHMAATDIFGHIHNTPNRIFLVRTSFMEIYNEEVRDLLGGNAVLQIREDPRKGVFVNAAEEIVTDFESLLRILFAGEKNRAVAATGMNERSSRSHTIFRITIESRHKSEASEDSPSDDGAVLISTLNLVDLAGSESVRHTGATGDRQKEGAKINQSLLTLSRVIVGLGQQNQAHINFRDSKLTRILQPSLSGNARMAVVCCATPSELYLEETRSTLLFASRAKLVKTKAQVNEVLDERSMIKRLQRELAEARRHSVGTGQIEQMKTLESEATKAGNAVKEAESKLQRLKSSLLNSSVLFGASHIDLIPGANDPASKWSLRSKKRRLSDGHIHVDRSGMLTPLKENVDIASPQSLRQPIKSERAGQIHAHLSPNTELALVRTAYDSKVGHTKTLQGIIAELEQKLTVEINEKENLEHAVETLKHAKEDSQKSIEDLEYEKSGLLDRVESLSGERVRGAFDLAQSNSERERLAKSLSENKRETQQMSEDISLLKATLRDAIEEKNQIVEQLSETRSTLEDVSAQKARADQQLASLTESLSTHKDELASALSANEDLASKNGSLEAEAASILAELENSRATIVKLTSTCNEQNESIQKLEENAEEAQTIHFSNMEMVTKQKEVVVRLEDTIQQLSTENEASAQQVHDFSDRIRELEDSIQVSERNLSETASELDDKKAEFTAQVKSCNVATAALEATEQRLNEAKSTIEDLVKDNEDKESRITTMSSHLDDMINRFVDMESSKCEVEEMIGESTAELQRILVEKCRISEELQEQAEKLSIVAEQRDTTQEALEKSEANKMNLNGVIEELEVEKEELKSRVEVLLKEKSRAAVDLEDFRAGKATVDAQLADATARVEEVCADKLRMVDQLQDRQCIIDALSLEREEAQSSLSFAKSQIEEHRAAQQRLEEEKTDLVKRLESEATREEEKQQAQLNDLTTECFELKQLLTDANRAVTQARQEAQSSSIELQHKSQSLEASIGHQKELESELHAASQRVASLESQGKEGKDGELAEELEALMTEKLNVEARLHEEISRREDSEAELRRLAGEEQRALVLEAESTMNALRSEAARLQEAASQAEADVYAARQENEELQDLNRRLEDKALESEVLRETEKVLKGKLSTLSESNCQLQRELELERKASSFDDNHDEEIATVKAELSRVKAESYASTQEAQDLRAELQQNRFETEAAAKEFRLSREQFAAALSSLENENHELLSQIRSLEVNGKENFLSTDEVGKLQQQVEQLSSELKRREARIQKLNATKLTKDQCAALKKIKDERVKFSKDANEYRIKLNEAQKQIAMLTSQLSQNSASSETGDASLKFEKEALETKFRKYAAHCQRLESEKAMMKDALESVQGFHVQHGDVTGAVVAMCDKISSLEEECEALSNAESKASSFLSELDRLREENASLHESMAKSETRLADLMGSGVTLESKLNETAEKMNSLRHERDHFKTIAESAQGNVENLENEKGRQVRYLEQENLQLMLDLKNAKKQIQSTRKQLDSMRLKVTDDDTVDFGTIPIAPLALPNNASGEVNPAVSSDTPGGVNDEFSTGWMRPENPVDDKENQPAEIRLNGVSGSASRSESTGKRRLPRIPRSAKKKLRNIATPGRAVGLGEAGDDGNENTTECKQS